MPVFKRLDDDEKWKSSALDDHQLDVVASLSIWTGEMTTAELSALGRRFCAAQAVVNSTITLLTMNYELGGERTNGLLAVALWCCWGGFGFAAFTQANRYRWQGPLVIFLVLTLLLVSVFTASNYDELGGAGTFRSTSTWAAQSPFPRRRWTLTQVDLSRPHPPARLCSYRSALEHGGLIAGVSQIVSQIHPHPNFRPLPTAIPTPGEPH